MLDSQDTGLTDKYNIDEESDSDKQFAGNQVLNLFSA
jgi:hypothetical protein